MITRYMFVILILFVLFREEVHAQPVSVAPLKLESPLFGTDIVLNSETNQDQRNVVACSAFNGWLYATFSWGNYITSYNSGYTGIPAYTIMKSIDNGITWDLLTWSILPPIFFQEEITSMDLAVSGDSVSNLKLFLAIALSDGSNWPGGGFVYRLNEETGAIEDTLLQDFPLKNIAISTDYMYPATNSNPYSIGILYSKPRWNGSKDSIIFCSSSNGGLSFDGRQVVTATSEYVGKVALTYGRCLSSFGGRYYAAWEERDNFNSPLGHIYTAHSNPYFNSSFTGKVNIDQLNAASNNNARNPSICCQYNNSDNVDGNITEVILFDTYVPSDNRYDIYGFYNLKSTITNNFIPFTLNLNDQSDNWQEASMNFNPYDSTFMVTYYDSTLQKLPFLKNNFNMSDPNTWIYVSGGYNDNASLAAPYPKVAMNFEQKKGVNVWNREGSGGNGIAMFDATYSDYQGIHENNPTIEQFFSIYPNPCNSILTLSFELHQDGKVNISIFDLTGQVIGVIANQEYSPGKHELKCNISNLSPGSYICILKTGNCVTSGKLMIVR